MAGVRPWEPHGRFKLLRVVPCHGASSTRRTCGGRDAGTSPAARGHCAGKRPGHGGGLHFILQGLCTLHEGSRKRQLR